MRSKFWVLAAGLSAVAAAAVAPAFAATAATATAAGLGAAGAATTTAAAPAAVQMLVPREAGMDAGAVRPVATTTTAPATRPAEPDPAQGPFPTSETLLLLAGLLAVGIIVRRRQ
jgi:hypothetical protein